MSFCDVPTRPTALDEVSSAEPAETCSTFAEVVRHRIERRLRSKITLLSHVAFWSFLAFCGLIALGLSLWIRSESEFLVSIGFSWWDLTLLSLEFAVASLVAWYAARRGRRVFLEVTNHPERSMSSICPLCTGDPFADDACCSAFVRCWTPSDLDRHWSDYAWDGARAVTVSRGNGDSAGFYIPMQRITCHLLGFIPSLRVSMYAQFGVLVIIAVALFVFMPSASRWAIILPIFGLLFLILSNLQPQSTIPLCRRCHYPASDEEKVAEGTCGANRREKRRAQRMRANHKFVKTCTQRT